MRSKLLVVLLLVPASLNARAQPRPALSCAEVPGLAPLLQPGHTILVGEMHGTNESPAFLQDAVCATLRAGHGVTVGLELPLSETTRVASFLDSPGDAGAVERLLQGAIWQRRYQDGRASRAMLDLLATLRAYRAAGLPVRLVLIDDPTTPALRDSVMSARIQTARAAAPDDVLLVLTGNVHNRLTRGTRWNEAYEPMGYLLQGAVGEARLVSLNVAHRGGEAWVCFGSSASDCGVKQLGGQAADGRGVTLLDEPAGQPYHGHYRVGRLTASLPAAGLPR